MSQPACVPRDDLQRHLCLSRGELKTQLIALLRSGRRPRSVGQDRRGQISEMVSIHVRPPKTDDRLMPGHWEGI